MLKGKRIGALDYGKKRIGFAVCDELHITVSPRKVFYTDMDFWPELIKSISDERLGAIVVGVPLRHDKTETELIIEIREFIEVLKSKVNLDVYEFDESFSTRRAVKTMIEIGKKKKNRSTRENKDKTAAAIILRDFLSENEPFKIEY